MTLNERCFTTPDGLSELQAELESQWPAMQATLLASGVPLNDETDEERTAREAREAEEASRAKTFTQAELDRIVQERVARVKATPPDDYEDLKAKAAKLDEIEAENKTELEKERERAAKAEAERDAALTTAKDTRLRSAILAEAAKADRKIVDPEAALQLLDKSTLELDDDGNPKNIAQAMDSLLEAKPFLVDSGGGTTTRTNGAADQGARGNGKEQIKSTDGMSSDEIAAAVADGRLDEYLKTTT